MADLSINLGDNEVLHAQETITVPTRIYFPSGTVPIEPSTNPAFDAAWASTGSAVRRKAVTDGRKKGTAAASVTVTSAATTPETILVAQYVSSPLRAQTISGNIRGQFRALESATGLNATIQVGIRVFSNNGATVRGTLLAVGGTTTTTTTPPEFATSLTNRRLLTSGDVTPLPLSSVVCQEGDRLVIEIGINDKSTSTTQTAQISFGDNTVDLTTDDTATTAQDPWIEFDTIVRFQNAVENVHVAGSGTAELMNRGWIKIDQESEVAAAIGLGSALFHQENPRLAESLTAVLDLGVIVASENLKAADGPPQASTAGTLDVTITGEALKLADGPALRTLDPLQGAPAGEALHVVDQAPTILPIWLVTAGPESLKLGDAGGGRTELIGVLHITDGPPAAAIIAGADLSVLVGQEALKLGDTATMARDLEPATAPGESLKLADTPTADEDRWAAVTAEGVKIADSATLTLDPLRTTPSEALKLQDGPPSASFSAGLNGTPASEDPIHVVDGPATGRLDPLQPTAALQDVIRLTDGPGTGLLDPLVRAVAQETLKLSDIGQGRTELVGQPQIHLVDGPVIATLSSTALSVAVADESLKLADSLSTQLPSLNVVVGDEVLKLSDRVVILSAVINETVKLSDIGGGQTSLIGFLRIQDGPVQAQVGGNLSIAVTETLKLADPLVGAERSPFEPGLLTETVKIAYVASEVEYIQDEYLRVVESLSAIVTAPGDLSTSINDEVVRLADSATMNRDLERSLSIEVARLADNVTAARGLTVVVTAEALLLTDAVSVARELEVQAADEALRAADSAPSRTLDPEEASGAEALRLAETLFVVLVENAEDLTVGQADEVLHLADDLAVFIDLNVSTQETVTLAEALDYGDGSLLEAATADETLVIGEEVSSVAELRAGAEQEDISIGEELDATLALVVVVAPEHIRGDDQDLLLAAIDLAVDIPGPDLPPIDVIAITDEALNDGMFTAEALSDVQVTDEQLLTA